jgi:hypothetical protein
VCDVCWCVCVQPFKKELLLEASKSEREETESERERRLEQVAHTHSGSSTAHGGSETAAMECVVRYIAFNIMC